MSIRDRWENLWQIDTDPKGVFTGVKDLEFSLKRIDSTSARVEYDFIYTPEDPNNDPFKNTRFTQFGRNFPSPPMNKLDKWQQSQKNAYDNLINATFGHPPSRYLRLEGEKEVGGNPVAITLFLLPDASSKFGNTSPYVDLIAPMSREQLDASFVFEDGTGHGNPR